MTQTDGVLHTAGFK